MKLRRHLVVEEKELLAGNEWTPNPSGWCFLRVGHGVAYWIARHGSHELSVGEVIVLAPSVAGSIRASQLGDVQLQSMEFCPALLSGFFTLSERHQLETLAAAEVPPIQFLPATHRTARAFAGVLAVPLEVNGAMHRCATLTMAVGFFAEQLRSRRPPQANGTLALHRFQELIQQMSDQTALEHTHEELARLCSCSRRHFGRLFRKHFGIALRSKQTELRLLLARQLLLDTDSKIIEVARRSGYRSLSLFNTLFKKAFGMTPSEWRRLHSKKSRTSRAQT